MHNSEWEELVRALAAGAQMSQPMPETANLQTFAKADADQGQGGSTVNPRAGQLTVERLLLASLPSDSHVTSQSVPPASSSADSDQSSVAMDVLKTIGLITGVGPVVTGLLKIFGGGDDKGEPSFAPIPFSLPDPISLEAGLTADRSLAPISYSQQSIARDVRPPAERAPIQINVQAMDSRSFLDHRDEIAQAVREAMLQSHSLNDIVAEI